MQLDKDDIRSYEQRKFLESPQKNEITPLTIFFAVLAAILVSWFVRAAYIEWQARQAIALINQQVQIFNEQTQQQLRNIQLQSDAMEAKAKEDTRLKAENLRQQKLAAQQLDLEKRATLVNQISERARKEETWSEVYKPTKGCEKDNPNRDTVKCGNDYAKARKQFEAAWLPNTN